MKMLEHLMCQKLQKNVQVLKGRIYYYKCNCLPLFLILIEHRTLNLILHTLDYCRTVNDCNYWTLANLTQFVEPVCHLLKYCEPEYAVNFISGNRACLE